MNAETGVLKAKGDAGSQATVQSIVTVTDPATAGEEHPTTKVYDAKEYTEVKIVSEGQAQTATLASTDPICGMLQKRCITSLLLVTLLLL